MEYNVHQVRRFKWTQCLSAPFYYVLLLSLCSSSPQSALATCSGSSLMHHMNLRPNPELLRRQTSNTPLVITNQCKESIYPGILTQSGVGPGTGGFGLAPGAQRVLTVSEAWQGRVWGRTNCSFNSAGDGPTSSTSNGQACGTGDCGGIMDCRGTGVVPVSLAEFTLDTGSGQTFYDISLVDGYNLPMAIVLRPKGNESFQAIPPNITNPSCVGSVGDLAAQGFDPYHTGTGTFLRTNASNPLPFDQKVSSSQVSTWCPANLEVNSKTGPSSGVYTYPDGNPERPQFDPCYSACAKFNRPSDCCTGSYDSPSSCQPSTYSKAVKAVCPDAYSYAFDDQTSTFIIPAGAGFEVVFCPHGRSTNILATEKAQLTELAQQGHVDKRNDVPSAIFSPRLSARNGFPKMNNSYGEIPPALAILQAELLQSRETLDYGEGLSPIGGPDALESLEDIANAPGKRLLASLPPSIATNPPSTPAQTSTYGAAYNPTSASWEDLGRWGNAAPLLTSSPSQQRLAKSTGNALQYARSGGVAVALRREYLSAAGLRMRAGFWLGVVAVSMFLFA